MIERASSEYFELSKSSPYFLQESYSVCKNSISNNVFSADNVSWDMLPPHLREQLIDDIIRGGYILSIDSPTFLCKNLRVAMFSVQNNTESYDYVHFSLSFNFDLRKILILNDGLSLHELNNLSLDYFLDYDIRNYCFKKFEFCSSSNEKYIERYNHLFSEFFNNPPSIQSLKNIFWFSGLDSWEEYRRENIFLFANIFGTICGDLTSHKDVFWIDSKEISKRLPFFKKMKEVLGENHYPVLLQAMNEYHSIYHSDREDKFEMLEKSRNTISRLSALYISKSKEYHIKMEMSSFFKSLGDYSSLNLNHPAVLKRAMYETKKRKFSKWLDNDRAEAFKYKNNLVKKYVDSFMAIDSYMDEDLVLDLVSDYLKDFISKEHHFNFDDYNPMNIKIYNSYLRFRKIEKLISRLNCGYISFDGVEVSNYKTDISYDDTKKTYYYSGSTFTDLEIEDFENYTKFLKLFGDIKRDIAGKVKSFSVCKDEIDEDILFPDFPYTDEFYCFSYSKILEEFTVHDFVNKVLQPLPVTVLLRDDYYDCFKNLFVDEGIFFLRLIFDDSVLSRLNLDLFSYSKFVNRFPKLISLSQTLQVSPSFDNMRRLQEVAECADLETIAILGEDVIYQLLSDREYIVDNDITVITRAKNLICKMAVKNLFTVPRVSGVYKDFKYSLYDTLDCDILLSGIYTGACFRICGNDNDFLYYCALDKNGFVVKFTNSLGEFVGRASGFRNGNCVFINQLRTIYENSSSKIRYAGVADDENHDLIDAFTCFCQDLITSSYENSLDKEKIDYVFVTKSYAMQSVNSNVHSDIVKKIGEYPMDYKSNDWKKFISESSSDLDDATLENGFETDYKENYPLICVASSFDLEKDNCFNHMRFTIDVPAVYKRKRSEITMIPSSDITKEELGKVNKIKAIRRLNLLSNSNDLKGQDDFPMDIDCSKKEEAFTLTQVPLDSYLVLGDNFYVIFNENKILESCLLDNDLDAFREYGIVLDEILPKYFDSSSCCSEIKNNYSKVYKKRLGTEE